MSTRTTQPYRSTGDRAPSAVLDAMRQGRSAARTESQLVATVRKRKGLPKSRALNVPRTKPAYPRY